ncbi:hypothetical protein DMENIID0001_032490 [Sergentomyia squamirostris]
MVAEEEPVKYFKDELTPPDFLNKEYLENVLQKAENDKALKITKLDIVPGSRAGDHFASVMFKAIVNYNSKGKTVDGRSLIIKTMPIEDGMKKELLKEMNVFGRETEMYTKVLPEMARIMESIGDTDEMGPRLVYHSTDPVVMIFDDITKYKYEMHTEFFDFDNVIKITKKLAKFHALSYYINDNKYTHKLNITEFESAFNENFFERLKGMFDAFDQLQKEVLNWPGYEKLGEKLSTQKDTLQEKLLPAYKANPEPGFNVLCHGDFHLRNMMFVMNGPNIDKVMFLDYQMCYWGSPAMDLYYILYAISNNDARDRRGEILSIYHQTFCEYLQRLGCLKKPFSLLDLNIEILKRGAMEVMWGICGMPMMCMDLSKLDLESIINAGGAMVDMRQLMFKNETVVEAMKKILPDLLHKGLLD